MALIANLAVALTAKTGEFSAKMLAARKPVEDFASKVESVKKRVLTSFNNMLPVALTSAALVGLGAVIKSSNEAIEKNLNLADKLGATYTQMIALSQAADLAGGNVESMTGAMEELQIRLGQGNKETEKSLKLLGLSSSSLMGKGAFQQITAIAQAFEKLTSSEQRAAVGADLFGKKSKELINFFMEGSATLKEAEGYVTRTGLAMSNVGAAKAKLFNDALAETWATTKGLGQQFTLMVNGPLTALLNGINKLYQGIVLIPRAWNAVNESINGMISRGPGLMEGLGESMKKIGVTAATAIGASDTANRLQGDLGEARGARGFPSATKDLAALTERRQGAIAEAMGKAQAAANAKAYSEMFVDARSRLGLVWMGVQDVMEKGSKIVAKKQEAESAASALGFRILRMGIEAQAESTAHFLTKIYQDTVSAKVSREFMIDPTKTGGPENSINGITSASAGTRGTFASDTAGRSVGTFSIEKEQLETQKSTLKILEKINTNLGDGVPVA